LVLSGILFMEINSIVQYIDCYPRAFWAYEHATSYIIIKYIVEDADPSYVDLLLHIEFKDANAIQIEHKHDGCSDTTRLFICGLEFICTRYKDDIYVSSTIL
jgi:hypothetical protein